MNTILFDSLQGELDALNAMPIILGKRFFSENKLFYKTYEKRCIYEDDDKICFTNTDFIIRFNTKFYSRQKGVKGFTYDKKTHKIKLWLGTSLNKLYNINEFYTYININWIQSLSFKNLITKTTLEKIISGKITNENELVTQMVKTSVRYNFDSNLLLSFFSMFDEVGTNQENPMNYLSKLSKYTVNPNEALNHCVTLFKTYKECNSKKDNEYLTSEFWENFPIKDIISNIPKCATLNITRYFLLFNTMLNECSYLESKMNTKWSYKRLLFEYELRINEIINMIVGDKGKEKINYVGELPLLYRAQLIDTELACYKESTVMHSNSIIKWKHIIKGEYFIVKTDYPERCTIGIDFNREGACQIESINGFNGYKISDEMIEIIFSWFNDKNVTDFFQNNKNIKDNEDNNENLSQNRFFNTNSSYF